MSVPLPPVTLTTDFGETDHYVAQMKGVILGLAPAAAVVDVTHAVPPQAVRRAAFLVADLADAFPAGTVHVAVVDPGVGSERAVLAVAAGGQFYVAPDNGLLTAVFDRHPEAAVVAVTNRARTRTTISATFHGRDVMAPAAAHLVCGGGLEDLGERLGPAPVRLEGLSPTVSAVGVEGTVAWIDRFGNAVTNVPASAVVAVPPERVRVRLTGREFVGLRRYYAQAGPGEPLALVGSSGRIEVAVNGGSAADLFGLREGDAVLVTGDLP